MDQALSKALLYEAVVRSAIAAGAAALVLDLHAWYDTPLGGLVFLTTFAALSVHRVLTRVARL